jgi:fused signal recognition particle receptor
LSLFSQFFGKKENTTPTPAKSWWLRLREGLARSSSALTTGLTTLFTHKKLDKATLNELEDLLIASDFGIETSAAIVKKLQTERYEKTLGEDEIKNFLAQEIIHRLAPIAKPLTLTHKPHIILVIGVNGAGKTTTIGKLAAKFNQEGHAVLLAAGDTFRAAAVAQLRVWAERANATFVCGEEGADAASLAFEALTQAKATNKDVVLIDTAGRLQNKEGLMQELAKIVRVIKKFNPEAPHSVLLVLDATTGQNALKQTEVFAAHTGVTGLIMTKFDGTARGGILVAIADKFALPVHFIGVGEGLEDLEPFGAEDFANALLDRKEDA